MRTLVYIALLFIITGCHYSNERQKELDEAGRIMLTDPKAAYDKLNLIDLSELSDSAAMAQWAMLYSEAMVANDISAPSDSIINIAVAYYDRHNRKDEFQKACRLKALMSTISNNDKLATSLYLQKEKEFMLYKERANRRQILYIGIIILMAAISVIVWQRQHIKLKSSQNDALVAEAYGMKCLIDSRNKDVDKLKSALQGLLENRFTLIDSLCQTYYESQGTKTERKAIADKVKQEIEAMRTDSFPEIERTVNDCRGDILKRLKQDYPDIKHDDYQLAAFIASGLSVRTISLLLGETVEVIYKRKSRLKARIKTKFPASSDILSIF